MQIDISGQPPIDLSIVSIRRIRPHERTLQSLLSSIKHDMRRSGYQRDPIIIDKNTNVALDGMHRRAALADFGAKYAVCAQFDYLDERVKLERWLRYIMAPSERLITKMISIFGLEECNNLEYALKSVDEERSSLAVVSRKMSYITFRNESASQIYSRIQQFDELCRAWCIEVNFADEATRFRLLTSDAVYLVYPIPLTKYDVLGMAERNRLLPFKTTRHIVPIRPMGIFYPLSELSGNRRECTNLLKEIVNLSNVEVRKRNVWYEGRKYSEPIAIFRRRANKR